MISGKKRSWSIDFEEVFKVLPRWVHPPYIKAVKWTGAHINEKLRHKITLLLYSVRNMWIIGAQLLLLHG
jgi:hypothetical protein